MDSIQVEKLLTDLVDSAAQARGENGELLPSFFFAALHIRGWHIVPIEPRSTKPGDEH